MGANNYVRANGAIEAEKKAEAFRLRKLGHSYSQIAEAIGVSITTAHRYVKREIEALIKEPAEEVRKLELERLDYLLDRTLQALDRDGSDESKLVPTALRVMERRAKLLGLDAPVKAEVAVTEVTRDDLELTELINEQRAKVAAEESALRGIQGEARGE